MPPEIEREVKKSDSKDNGDQGLAHVDRIRLFHRPQIETGASLVSPIQGDKMVFDDIYKKIKNPPGGGSDDITNFASAAKEELKSLHPSETGSITRASLAAKLDQQGLSSAESKTVAGMYSMLIDKGRDDAARAKTRPDTLSKAGTELEPIDLSRVQAYENSYLKGQNLKHTIDQGLNEKLKHFLDPSDGVNGISRGALKHAIRPNDGHLTPAENQAAAALNENFGSLSIVGPQVSPTLKLSDLPKSNAFPRIPYEDHRLRDVFSSVDKALPVGSPEGLFGKDGQPSPAGVQQNRIGDCYFLAALSAKVRTDPESIKKMIQPKPDGTFDVTFPGDPTKPVNVTAPTPAEAGVYNHGDQAGNWASLLEKAYGQHRGSEPGRQPGLTPAEGADGGGLYEGLSMLTGKEVHSYPTSKLSPSDLADKLDFALNHGAPKPVLAYSSPKVKDFIPSHMLSVQSFARTGDGEGLVTMRNPWNMPEMKYGSSFVLSLSEFQSKLENVGFSD